MHLFFIPASVATVKIWQNYKNVSYKKQCVIIRNIDFLWLKTQRAQFESARREDENFKSEVDTLI